MFILLEKAILWVKDLLTNFDDEFFEQAATIDALFDLAQLVEEFNGELLLHIELLHEQLGECILNYCSPCDGDRVDVVAAVLDSLEDEQVLEDFSAENERNCVRDVDEVSVADHVNELLGGLVLAFELKVLFDDPKVLTIQIEPFITVIQLVKRALEVIHKVCLEIVHRVLTEEYTIGHIV